MVSKARLDLPEPDRPVMTVRLSRGISTSTFFRLCSRAPRTWMEPAIEGGFLCGIRAGEGWIVFLNCSPYMDPSVANGKPGPAFLARHSWHGGRAGNRVGRRGLGQGMVAWLAV